MIINKFNIEKWIFDYFEGNLSKHEQIEFERFLEDNPQFETEFQFWEESYDSSLEVPVYEVPNSLYKPSPFYNKQSLVYLSLFLIFIASVFTLNNIESKAVLKNNNADQIVKGDFIKTLSTKENLIIDEGLINNSNKDVKIIIEKSQKDESNLKKEDKNINNKVSKGIYNEQDFKSNKAIKVTKSDQLKQFNKVQLVLMKLLMIENISDKAYKPKKYNSRYAFKKSSVELQLPEIEKKLIAFNGNELNNGKYSYLEFKRNKSERKYKEIRRKRKNEKLESRFKSRDRSYFDNLALIATFFYDNKGKEKRTGRPSKLFDKLKNKEIALTNTHDPIFIKTNANPIDNNIALAGGLDITRVKTNLSNRWNNSLNKKNEGLITSDTYFKKINAGVGLSLKTSALPAYNFNNTSSGVTYSQRIELKEESSLNVALNYRYNRTKMSNNSLDNFNQLEFQQNIVNNVTFNESVNSHHIFSTGLWYDGKFLYGGINIDNIKTIKNKNNNANEFVEYINPFKFAMQLGTDYRRNVYSALVISPQLNYSYQQETSELWVGSMMKYKHFLTGVGATFSNAYKVSIGAQGNNFRLIYGFDYSKSKNEGQFYGNHEVSLRYLLRGKNNWNK